MNSWFWETVFLLFFVLCVCVLAYKSRKND